MANEQKKLISNSVNQRESPRSINSGISDFFSNFGSLDSTTKRLKQSFDESFDQSGWHWKLAIACMMDKQEVQTTQQHFEILDKTGDRFVPLDNVMEFLKEQDAVNLPGACRWKTH